MVKGKKGIPARSVKAKTAAPVRCGTGRSALAGERTAKRSAGPSAPPMGVAAIRKEHDEMVRKLIDFYLGEGHEIKFAALDGHERPPTVGGCAPDVITQYYRFPIMAEIGRCDTSGMDAMVERMKVFYAQRQAKPDTRLHFAAHEDCLYPYQRRFAEAGIIVDRYILL